MAMQWLSAHCPTISIEPSHTKKAKCCCFENNSDWKERGINPYAQKMKNTHARHQRAWGRQAAPHLHARLPKRTTKVELPMQQSLANGILEAGETSRRRKKRVNSRFHVRTLKNLPAPKTNRVNRRVLHLRSKRMHGTNRGAQLFSGWETGKHHWWNWSSEMSHESCWLGVSWAGWK